MSNRQLKPALVGPVDPAAVGAALTRFGLLIIAMTLPVVAGTFAGLLATAGSPTAAVATALAAMTGSLVAGDGLPWLFHVTALLLLCGCWLLGAGLVVEGLVD